MLIASQVGIRYVWIDQLCVDQNDPSDVEKHLQCMQRVYAKSSYTLAPFSCCLGDPYMIRSLRSFLQETSSHLNIP
jgi:hypothetical protein